MLAEIRFYLSLLLRRIHYFLAVAIVVFALAVKIAYSLPPVYEAKAQLIVESPQIPGDLASSTVQVSAAEILQIIHQRLLTRANLLEIAREFRVYSNTVDMSPDDMVTDMRRRITMTLPRQSDTAAFVSISFAAENGNTSAQVVNNLVTRVLEENIAMRKAASGQTLQFFEREVTRLDQDLAEQGQRILQFKLENKDALPESLEYRRSRQATLQERILQLDRSVVALQDRKTRLQDIYQRTGRTPTDERDLPPDQRRLVALQDELATALSIYSDQNPRILALRRQIEVVEAKLAREETEDPNASEDLTPFGLQMADLDSQIGFTTDQLNITQAELDTINKTIEDTPANAVTLGTLERDYDNLRAQYNQATAALATARTGDQIEAQSRGQRISVIEQAIPPREPTSPNRRKIALAGMGAGIFGGLALVALIEFLSSSIRRPVDLSNKLGISPFGVIPYIQTREQQLRRRTLIWASLAVIGIGVPIALFLINQYYLPLDYILDMLMQKSGLTDFLKKAGLGQQ